MAPRRGSQQPQQLPAAEPQTLPVTDATQLDIPSWIRELASCTHLFDADVAYFIHTGCGLAQAKTAVISKEHSALLKNNFIQQERFGILNPPPVDDGFKQLYASTRAKLLASASGTAGAMAAAILPATPPDVPDSHVIAPDRILLLDLKLRNIILGLITSRGRKRHYQNLSLIHI